MTTIAQALLPLWAALALLAGNGWLGIYLADTARPTVAEVVPDSPAAHGGLTVGDVIAAVDGQKVDTPDALVKQIAALDPGTEVKLSIERGDQTTELVVVLGQRPAEPAQPPREPRAPARRPAAPAPESTSPAATKAWLGVVLQITDGGLLVQGVTDGGPAAKAGLKAGDALRSIGDQPVPDWDALQQALKDCEPGHEIQVGVRRGDQVVTLPLTVGSVPVQRGEGLRPVEPPTAGGQMRPVEPSIEQLRAEIERLRTEQQRLVQRLDAIGKRLDQLDQRLDRAGRDG